MPYALNHYLAISINNVYVQCTTLIIIYIAESTVIYYYNYSFMFIPTRINATENCKGPLTCHRPTMSTMLYNRKAINTSVLPSYKIKVSTNFLLNKFLS